MAGQFVKSAIAVWYDPAVTSTNDLVDRLGDEGVAHVHVDHEGAASNAFYNDVAGTFDIPEVEIHPSQTGTVTP